MDSKRPINVYQVVLEQSGYIADFGAVTYRELFSTLDDFNDEVSQTTSLYELIYRKMYKTNTAFNENGEFSKPRYMDWLKNTAYADTETMLYGIYAATYPETSIITIDCGACNTGSKYTVYNSSLVHPPVNPINAKQYFKRVSDIKSHAIDADYYKTCGISVEKEESIEMSDNGLILNLKNPSIYEYIVHLQQTSPFIREKYRGDFEDAAFISSMLVYNKNTGSYGKMTDRNTIVSAIASLDALTHKEFCTILHELYYDKTARYEIDDVQCPNDKCKAKIKIPLDIDDMLFHTKSRRVPVVFPEESDVARQNKLKAYQDNRAKISKSKRSLYRSILDTMSETFAGQIELTEILETEIPVIDALIEAKSEKNIEENRARQEQRQKEDATAARNKLK